MAAEPPTPRDPETFGGRLAICRAARCLDQNDLAALLGVSQGRISGWESCRHAPALEVVVEICRVLQVSADSLLGTRPLEIPALR